MNTQTTTANAEPTPEVSRQQRRALARRAKKESRRQITEIQVGFNKPRYATPEGHATRMRQFSDKMRSIA